MTSKISNKLYRNASRAEGERGSKIDFCKGGGHIIFGIYRIKNVNLSDILGIVSEQKYEKYPISFSEFPNKNAKSVRKVLW